MLTYTLHPVSPKSARFNRSKTHSHTSILDYHVVLKSPDRPRFKQRKNTGKYKPDNSLFKSFQRVLREISSPTPLCVRLWGRDSEHATFNRHNDFKKLLKRRQTTEYLDPTVYAQTLSKYADRYKSQRSNDLETGLRMAWTDSETDHQGTHYLKKSLISLLHYRQIQLNLNPLNQRFTLPFHVALQHDSRDIKQPLNQFTVASSANSITGNSIHMHVFCRSISSVDYDSLLLAWNEVIGDNGSIELYWRILDDVWQIPEKSNCLPVG